MRLTTCLTVLAGLVVLVVASAHADPQTHGADYKMRGMTETRSSQSNNYYNSYYNNSAPVVAVPSTPAPAVAQQPTQRRSFSVEPTVKQPCGQPQVAPAAPVAKQPATPRAPIAQQQPQTTQRRSLSVEPTPTPTYNYNYTPSYQNRSFNQGAPYLRADSKASRY